MAYSFLNVCFQQVAIVFLCQGISISHPQECVKIFKLCMDYFVQKEGICGWEAEGVF